jgi:general secretion pathway protein N
MKRGMRAAWMALLFAVALTAAFCLLPARWVIAWIPDSSPVLITDATGTLWEASATMAVGIGGLRRSLPDPLLWHLSFKGGPHLVLAHPWLRGSLKVALTWQGLHMSAQSLQLPAAALTTVHGIFNTLDPGGEVLLTWPDLYLRSGVVASSNATQLLSVQWRNATSTLTHVRPMGQYTLVLSQAGNGSMALALATNKGPWMMEGSGILPQSGRLRFDGKAWVHESATADIHAAMQGVLDAIGPRSIHSGHTMMTIR